MGPFKNDEKYELLNGIILIIQSGWWLSHPETYENQSGIIISCLWLKIEKHMLVGGFNPLVSWDDDSQYMQK